MNDLVPILKPLRETGFRFLSAAEFQPLIAATAVEVQDLRAAWQDMPLDTYMADAGRYRRRRYAVMNARTLDDLVIEPEQPHFQNLSYNRLNGGIERWYAPIAPHTLHLRVFRSVLGFALDLLSQLAGPHHWHIEAHQFRIEAGPDLPGQPTPEGVHRDGVDFVLVMLVDRQNIERGTTTVHATDGQQLDAFTLTETFDLALLDDHRCLHGVTPVLPKDPHQPAWRDVLVLTFRAQDQQSISTRFRPPALAR